jgi:hypothetical protein
LTRIGNQKLIELDPLVNNGFQESGQPLLFCGAKSSGLGLSVSAAVLSSGLKTTSS